MTFQVKDFEFQDKQQEIIWKFNLSDLNTPQIDFYSQDESVRSLYHLTLDYSLQIQTQIERKKKKTIKNNRAVRKVCQKLLKSLQVKLSHFAHDIEENKNDVRKYFQKEELEQATRTRIIDKCRKWIIQAWVKLFQEFQDSFFQRIYNNYKKESDWTLYFTFLNNNLASHKYLTSYIKDRKRLCPDYQLLNQIYLIVIGNDNTQIHQLQNQTNNNLILIDINLNIEDKYVSQSFLWNPDNNSNIAIDNFIVHFLSDILLEQNITLDRQTHKQLIQQAKIQLKTQVCYKMLLKKYAGLLLNFSTMQLSQDIRQYNIQIQLKISDQNNNIIFQDSFQWDILNQANNVQKFCQRLIQDTGLSQKYFSELCYKIRTQINAQLEWKFTMLVKTYKSILRDRQSPKFHTQTTTTQIKKNLVYTMDVSLPYNPDQISKVQNVYFNNSDLFSLLSRNIDILPQQFQQILLCRQSNKNQQKQLNNKLTIHQADQHLTKLNLGLDNNPYLGNCANYYTQHKIWRQSLEK